MDRCQASDFPCFFQLNQQVTPLPMHPTDFTDTQFLPLCHIIFVPIQLVAGEERKIAEWNSNSPLRVPYGQENAPPLTMIWKVERQEFEARSGKEAPLP
jgi:hypothetical protein